MLRIYVCRIDTSLRKEYMSHTEKLHLICTLYIKYLQIVLIERKLLQARNIYNGECTRCIEYLHFLERTICRIDTSHRLEYMLHIEYIHLVCTMYIEYLQITPHRKECTSSKEYIQWRMY